MKKKNIIVCLSIILLILIDLLTKMLVIKNMELSESLIIIPNFFKFCYIRNTGAAFGILKGNTFILVLFTISMIYYLIKELIAKTTSKISIISYVLIISGAIGNLIDRVFRKYVIDFISFTLFSYEMAIFNIADIYITIGVGLFVYSIFKK